MKRLLILAVVGLVSASCDEALSSITGPTPDLERDDGDDGNERSRHEDS